MATAVETPTPAPPTAPPPAAPPASAPPATPPATPVTAPPASEPPAQPPPPPTAPVTYQLVTPPESGLDDADRTAIEAMARGKSWTNEQAQAAFDEYAAAMKTQRDTFKAELDTHAEIGGAKFPVAQENAMRALDRFLPAGTPDGDRFRSDMNKSGYGNYAPLMVLLAHVGAAMREDTPIHPNPSTGTPPARVSDATALYPKTTPT